MEFIIEKSEQSFYQLLMLGMEKRRLHLKEHSNCRPPTPWKKINSWKLNIHEGQKSQLLVEISAQRDAWWNNWLYYLFSIKLAIHFLHMWLINISSYLSCFSWVAGQEMLTRFCFFCSGEIPAAFQPFFFFFFRANLQVAFAKKTHYRHFSSLY